MNRALSASSHASGLGQAFLGEARLRCPVKFWRRGLVAAALFRETGQTARRASSSISPTSSTKPRPPGHPGGNVMLIAALKARIEPLQLAEMGGGERDAARERREDFMRATAPTSCVGAGRRDLLSSVRRARPCVKTSQQDGENAG